MYTIPRLGTLTMQSIRENGRKFSSAAPVAFKFHVEHGRQLLFPSCGLFLASNLHGGRIKHRQSLKTFPFWAIERLCSKSALPKRSKVNLATRPETQITSTSFHFGFNRGQTQEHAQCTPTRSPAAKISRAKIQLKPLQNRCYAKKI